MGRGYGFICSQCGNEYGYGIGVGFLFPMVYEETLKEVKKGKYGEEWKNLVKNTKNIAIDAEEHLYVCKKCGTWKTEEGLSLYTPKDKKALKTKNNDSRWAVGFDFSQASYVTSEELREYYKLLKSYTHRCPKCKARMHRATSEEAFNLPCPKCGGKAKEDYLDIINWD